MKRTAICSALLATVLTVATLPLAADPATQVDTKAVRVALFKNGLAFFIRQGDLPTRAGEVEIGPLPAASHGTLWLGFGPGVELANLSAREVKVMEGRLALTIPELLEANVGKRVRLEFASEFRTPVEGVLKAYPQPQERPPVNPYMADLVPPPSPQSQLLLVQAEGGMVAINPGSVDRIVFLEDPNTTVSDELKRISLSGELLKSAANQPLSVSYLAKGMTWAPSYLVDISDPKQAMLTAKACILNDIEDLDGAQVDLITGFPHLEFAEIISPLAKKEDLAGFLNALGSGYSAGRRRADYGGVTAQAAANVMYQYERGEPTVPVPDYGAAAAGIAAEDLFFYPLEGVTLERGAVGYYPLFTEKVGYQHIYEWDIPDYVNEEDYYRREEEQEVRQIVWHSLRLENSTGMPWTTAPAATMQEGRVLGQATLHYTPVAGETMLKITQALGIKADQLELEVDREVGALKQYGRIYDRVTVEGTLELRSHLDKPVKVKVAKTLTGNVKSADPQPKVEKLAAGLKRVNPRSRLTWEVTVGAGQEMTITYAYVVHIRH